MSARPFCEAAAGLGRVSRSLDTFEAGSAVLRELRTCKECRKGVLAGFLEGVDFPERRRAPSTLSLSLELRERAQHPVLGRSVGLGGYRASQPRSHAAVLAMGVSEGPEGGLPYDR